MTAPDAAALHLAQHLANLADAATLRGWRGPLDVQTKPDGSIVTAVDLNVNDMIVATLARERPGDAVHAEESAVAGVVTTGRQWYIDPLDQTVNYSRGLPEFATLIALYAGEVPLCAVVSAPALQERWWATSGQGARNITGPITVSETSAITDALASIAAPHRFIDLECVRGHDLTPDATILSFSRHCAATTGAGGFLGHMRVAEGKIDVALDPWGEAWDLAASALIIHEAGGEFTSLTGRPSIHERSALASNGRLHSASLRLVRNDAEGVHV